MYSHLLVAVDESESSGRAVRLATKLALQLSTRLTLCYVCSPYSALLLPGFHGAGVAMLDDADFRRRSVQRQHRVLAPLAALAAAEGITADTITREHLHPWSGVLQGSAAVHADCIVTALGGDTRQMLAHANCPVLVVR